MAKTHSARPTPRPQPAPPAAPEMTLDRVVIAATVVATTLAFLTSTNDVFGVTKFTVLLLGAITLLGVWAWRAVTERQFAMETSAWRWLVAAFIGVMAVTSLIAERPALGFFGEYGRAAGVLTFACGAILAVGIVITHDVRDLRTVAWTLGGMTVPVLLYGLLQTIDVEPFKVSQVASGVGSTLGQPNFLSGYLAITLPFLVWALVTRTQLWERLVASALLVAFVVVQLQTKSFQGIAGSIVALAAIGGYLALTRLPRRPVLVGGGAIAAAGALVVLVLHDQITDQIRSGLSERLLFWETARTMIGRHPLLGWGMSGFASDFTRYRPSEHAVKSGVFDLADAPHSIPLAFLVAGGVVLLVAYLALVGYVGLQLVRGMRRTRGETQLLLATFGAAWLAYHVQSLVSIDVVPLIVLHLVVAAAIVVLGRQPDIVLVGPGRPRQRRGRSTPVSAATRGAQAAVVVVALALAWFSIRPLRADLAYVHARQATADQDDETRLSESKRATDLAPWHGVYWAGYAAALAATGDADKALAVGAETIRRNPGFPSYVLSSAQLADRVGRTDDARRYFELAEKVSPDTPVVLAAHAQFLVAHDQERKALPLAIRAAKLGNGDYTYALLVAKLYDELGRKAQARDWYVKTLQLSPSSEEALRALGRIP